MSVWRGSMQEYWQYCTFISLFTMGPSGIRPTVSRTPLLSTTLGKLGPVFTLAAAHHWNKDRIWTLDRCKINQKPWEYPGNWVPEIQMGVHINDLFKTHNCMHKEEKVLLQQQRHILPSKYHTSTHKLQSTPEHNKEWLLRVPPDGGGIIPW